jgi:hypothetical protein
MSSMEFMASSSMDYIIVSPDNAKSRMVAGGGIAVVLNEFPSKDGVSIQPKMIAFYHASH